MEQKASEMLRKTTNCRTFATYFLQVTVLSMLALCLANERRTIPGDLYKEMVKELTQIPETLECFQPLIASIPLQLLAYHIAVCKSKDVDRPRNLAKSVTVE